jgi:hypothetical protein
LLNCPSLPPFNEVNPVRNSIEASNPAGIILGLNPAVGGTAEQPGIISNGVKFVCASKKPLHHGS